MLTCFVLWAGWESLEMPTCIRSKGLEQSPGLKARQLIPRRAHTPGLESHAGATRRSGPKVKARVDAVAGTANRGIAVPTLRPLAVVRPRPYRQIRPGPLVAGCRLAVKPEECRVPSASARAAELLGASSLPPASVSLPRPWPRGKPALIPPIHAATTGPPGTERMLAPVEAAVEDELALATDLTTEAVVVAAAVQHSEKAAAEVSSPPEGASHGEVQTWPDWVGCYSEGLLEEVSWSPEM